MRFTDRFIRSLQTEGKRYEMGDGNGLYIRVSPNGSKVWVFKFKEGGKLKRMTLGTYPALSLAAARKEAVDAQLRIEQGNHPAPQRVVERKSPTVQAFAEEFIERWAKPNKKTWKEDQRILEKYFIPSIGYLKLQKVHRRDIVSVLDEIRDRGSHVQANRAYAVFRRLCNFAIERGVLDSSPAIGIKMSTEQSRDRVLTEEELKSFFDGMKKQSLWIGTRLALEVLLRTGQRPGEILNMKPEEIDLKQNLWIIPAPKSKNGNTQVVPLPEQVQRLISTALELSSSDSWVFRSPRKENSTMALPALNRAMGRVLERNGVEKATPHDLRRTAATYIGGLGVNRLTISKILNHTDQSIDAVYDRYSYQAEKLEALQKWNDKLDRILAGEGENKVLTFRAANE